MQKSPRKTCKSLVADKMIKNKSEVFASYHPYKNFEDWIECYKQAGVGPQPLDYEEDAALAEASHRSEVAPRAFLRKSEDTWTFDFVKALPGNGFVWPLLIFTGLLIMAMFGFRAWNRCDVEGTKISSAENRARRVTLPQGAVELVSKWVERSDSGQGSFTLGREMPGDHGLAEPLSFYQALQCQDPWALLRSQALESLLETCTKVPALRSELLKGKRPGVDSDMVPSALSRALQCLVERLLLPGALSLWPTLLEALLGDEFGPLKAGSCRLWAKRALSLVKRQWKYELIPSTLRCLDRKLAALVAPPQEVGDTAELLRSKEGMSKVGIRAALNRTRLKAAEAEAMGEFKETLSSFSAKRDLLEAEQKTLTLRLEEVQMQLMELEDRELSAKGQSCIDCGLPDADWASVSCGAYLCVDCAGRHRGLGVHLSFVRSTTMDIWSPQQLRRMQLGGTHRFREFLEGYPKLQEPHSSESLFARYNSRAVAYYRQLLELQCEGKSTAAWQTQPTG
eukprot:g2019.t1